jgi:3-hydroxyisobutyrate dehydrogenase-like beta-hydroxyacid dehydrogenase
MGGAIARNLVAAGHRVSVYNRTPARAEALVQAGARLALTPAEAGRNPVAITMLADDAAVEAIVMGEDGMAAGLAAGGIHVSMSTISVALADRLDSYHRERDQIFVAAPVFGRPEAAAARKLFVTAAGNDAAIAALRPVFDAIGQRLFVIGGRPSQACLVKLAGNFLITCVIESLAEIFALTRKGGVASEIVFDLLTETLFSAPVYKIYGKILLEERFEEVGFALPLGLKDNRLVQQAAEALSVPLPFAAIVRDRFLASIAKGDGDLDWSAFARRATEDAGLDIGPAENGTRSPS